MITGAIFTGVNSASSIATYTVMDSTFTGNSVDGTNGGGGMCNCHLLSGRFLCHNLSLL